MPGSMHVSNYLSDGVKSYLQHGYWIGKNVLDPERVLAVRNEMHEIFRQQLRYLGLPCSPGTEENAMHKDMVDLLRADKDRYVASLRLCPKLSSVTALYLSPGLAEFAARVGMTLPVFQTAPVFHVMSEDLRIPGGYYGYSPHQDWPALQSGLDTVTMWVPFVTVDESNYTLDVVPGSHLRGLLPGTMQDNAYETDPKAYHEEDFLSVNAQPGDVLFMSCFMVHRSSLKGGKRMRVACSMRYENCTDPTFIAHAYPFVHKRVVQREFLFSDLPTEEQVRSVFRV
jgi:ectoine hydroxylase-related dioxygenase (phytanoyl-CoA dioxygenase family)